MKISENSYIKQTVVLEAESPYLAFNVEVCKLYIPFRF